MAIAEGSNPGNTIFASLNDILPRMVLACLAARRKSSVKEILADAKDLAIDIGGEIGPEITGLGMIKRLEQSALKIGAIVRRHRGKENDSSSAGNKVNTIVDSVLDDLSFLFDRRSPYYAKIPLVIFIADAQFADNDPAMPTFLEKLLARSAREDWPLLLGFTHWSRQLGLWKDSNDQWREPSHVAKVIEHAMMPDKKVAGAFAKEPA